MIGIYVLQRGFVVVGVPTREGTLGERIRLDHSACIRRWSGNGGLEKLAAEGPEHAVLDTGGGGIRRRFHELTVIQETEVSESAYAAWAKALGVPHGQ